MRQSTPPANVPYDPFMEREGKDTVLLHKRTTDLNTGWHAHSKGQLLYAEHGVTRLYIAGSSFLLPTRHCAWIPAHMAHLVTSSSPNLFLRTLYFTIEPELTHPFYCTPSVFQVSELLREMIVYTERWAASNQRSAQEQSFLHTLKLILPDLQGASLGLRLPSSEHPRVQEIIRYLLDHLSEKISVEAIAQNMALSTRTVARLFQQELGMSLTGFLKVARILKALELLSLPGANVSTTAYQVGYDSIPTFSNSFYEVVGARPQSFLQSRP